jgi:hypothetical protein
MADGQPNGSERNRINADQFAANLRPMILELQANGAGYREIARELAQRGIKTARGGEWSRTHIFRILRRTGAT